MRFQVAKRDLDSALQVVTSSLDSSSNADLTTHYVFRRTGSDDEGHGVEVLTTSGKLFSSCPVKVKVLDPGTEKGVFTIEGKRLKQWLQYVSDAALTLELVDSMVVATAPMGQQTFQSLAVDSRYNWSKSLQEAQHTATIAAPRLAAALGYSAKFASTKENDQPDLCVCEIKDGVLYSTDKKAVTLIRVAGMEKSKLRVHATNVKSFTAFLAECDTGDVEVLEHDRMLIIRRGDGAIFGETRFQSAFPGLNVGMDDKDQHLWTLPKEGILDAIGFLQSGAEKNDNRLRMAPGDDVAVLSMMSATGQRTELSIPAGEMASKEGKPPVPTSGFDVDHFCLAKVLGAWKGDDIVFGLNVKGPRGYVRFVAEQEGDMYLTIMAWLQ